MSDHIVKDYQNLLYHLIQEQVMSLQGVLMETEGRPEYYLPKDEVVDRLIIVLNQFGENMASDERLKADETDASADLPVSGTDQKAE